jgi:hypothetical protein
MSLPKIVQKNPEPLPQSLTTGTLAKTVDLSSAAANFSIGTIPAGSVVSHVAVELPATISAATAVKIGVGRLTATADPDKYWLSADLTAVSDSAVLLATSTTVAAAEEIGLFACDTNGAAAGTIGGVAGEYVRVVVGYITAERF